MRKVLRLQLKDRQRMYIIYERRNLIANKLEKFSLANEIQIKTLIKCQFPPNEFFLKF